MKQLIFIGITLLFLDGCANPEVIKVKNEVYRTGDASNALLGSVGYTSGAGMFGGLNRFELKRVPDYKNIKLHYGGVITLEEIKHSYANFEFDADAMLKKSIQANTGVKAIREIDGKLNVKYHIISFQSPDDAILSINGEHNKRAQILLKGGKSASRIISKILVAYDYEQSKVFDVSGSFALNGSDGDVEIINKKIALGLAAGEKGSSNVKLSDGMIVGYTYDILCWHKLDNGKIELLTSIKDKYGATQSCHSGMQNPEEL